MNNQASTDAAWPTPQTPCEGAVSPLEVSIIIVSYNTREVTLACLDSIVKYTTSCTFEIILIDNGSSDGTLDAVRARFPSVRIVANTKNIGFAAANNQGIALATGQYILLLNPDTEVDEYSISNTLHYARQRPEAGVIGVRCIGVDGEQQSTLFRTKRLAEVCINAFIPNRMMRRSRILGRSRYVGANLDHEQDVEIVAGCFMFVNRVALSQIGGMDEQFFMYGEEAEWCHRFRSRGWKVRYFPGARILHYGGVSTDRSPAQMNIAMAKSNLLLIQKTQGRMSAYLANLFMLLRDGPRAAAWLFMKPFARNRPGAMAQSCRRAAGRFLLHFTGLVRTDWST